MSSKFKFNLNYAIGELVIIIVGISIAFYIEGWRMQKDREKTEIAILQQLAVSLDRDISDLETNARSDAETVRRHDVIINNLEEGGVYNDSLAAYFGRLGYYTNFINNSSAYENLKSIGIDYISNDSLRLAIADYYELHSKYLIEIEKDIINTQEETVIAPLMMEHFDYSSFFNPAYPNDYRSLQKNSMFKSAIKTTKRLMEWKIRLTQSCLESAQTLKNVIERELKRR
ncbi:MAG: DUF6090 family protein [Cyclobacteriaceae bacterium]